MTGVPDEVAKVSTLPPLELSSQNCAPFVSAKFKLPMVRDVSNVTIRLAVMSMVLKSAVESVPSPTVPVSQLVVALQTLLASFVQVPLAARAPARLTRKTKPMGNIFILTGLWATTDDRHCLGGAKTNRRVAIGFLVCGWGTAGELFIISWLSIQPCAVSPSNPTLISKQTYAIR